MCAGNSKFSSGFRFLAKCHWPLKELRDGETIPIIENITPIVECAQPSQLFNAVICLEKVVNVTVSPGLLLKMYLGSWTNGTDIQQLQLEQA